MYLLINQKLKKLTNVEMLSELPFYNESNIANKNSI